MRVAVVLPCRDEARTVTDVVAGFRRSLPDAEVHVFDNASSDGTAARASDAGATVHHVATPGKGNVVRAMFTDVDADVYVMADGDGTYDPRVAPELVRRLVEAPVDLVLATRVLTAGGRRRARAGHTLGNRLLTGLYRRLFGLDVGDVFSGYLALTRRLARSFPATATGFEVETELLAHAADVGAAVGEVPGTYRPRSRREGAKLATVRDGTRIVRTALRLGVRHRRPGSGREERRRRFAAQPRLP